MKRSLMFLGCFAALILFSAQRCDEKEKTDKAVLEKLYKDYQFGQIEACTYEGKKVFHAGINAFDAGSQVYDENGRSIATCNYMTGMVDPPCEKLQDCETIYRCENHISGQPAVDKYELGKSPAQQQK